MKNKLFESYFGSAAPRRLSLFSSSVVDWIHGVADNLGEREEIAPRTKERTSGAAKEHFKRGQSYPRTDSGNAELFAQLHGENVRFDHKQGRWLLWETKGGRWKEDKEGKVRGLMKNTARNRLQTAVGGNHDESRDREVGWAIQSEHRFRIIAALELAKSEVPVSDTGDCWDADPWLLAVANGVVDLRNGKLRKGTRTDRLTKSSPVVFDSAASCPRFEQFVAEIFDGDKDLMHFVQKAVGYSLTGSVAEQCLFACYGEGRNGKSTLLEILLFMFGEYGIDLPFAALEAKNNMGEGVDLPGSRFAKSVEVREAGRLDEARLKAWTGGDTISIRALYRNSFSFKPTHKMWLAFNHKPVISDNSPGMWRRIRLIPFRCKFKEAEADKGLLEKLKAESPGVLNWAIKGCLAWQKEGLDVPRIVAEATSEYQDESDVLSPFLDDCCVLDPNSSVASIDLWTVYQAWANSSGDRSLARNTFAEHLKRRGFISAEAGHEKRRVWRGLTLRPGEAGVRADQQAASGSFYSSSSDVELHPTGHPQTPAAVEESEKKEPSATTLGVSTNCEEPKCSG
jgi:putative DNA primase/helicase